MADFHSNPDFAEDIRKEVVAHKLELPDCNPVDSDCMDFAELLQGTVPNPRLDIVKQGSDCNYIPAGCYTDRLDRRYYHRVVDLDKLNALVDSLKGRRFEGHCNSTQVG